MQARQRNVGEQVLICRPANLAAVLRDAFYEPMRTLLGYWRERVGPGGVLDRTRLHPEELAPLLPNLFLMDRLEGAPFDIAFRLVGTAIPQIEGEITGRSLSSLIARSEHPMVWEHYERALAGELCLRRQTLVWQDRDYVRYDVLLLPMSRGGAAIDALLGMALYRLLGDGPDRVAMPVGPMV
ncbi:PAS domain-containing protein [Tistlia consotensis]|uniref:PAS domain-containing protein n=1 Tax=Tistlia consotensis USBA 355 TaxID=560819 RepID=A0A1Y6C0V8_9PROT|nr:PAS domain-containing protein [Tistlia consotensis]SMF38576.1 PAS domain-containing protein [Tistlia consotensis USBA 355]SNR37051.1 PAS domain-containing protein [Tistlia consotensis]